MSRQPNESAAQPYEAPGAPQGPTLYFAYGSNLHLLQMASRCPGSTFVGRGVLTGWRWQINQRGYANVVKSARETSRVEGLVYRITPSDEARLDLSEGVAIGCHRDCIISKRFFFPGMKQDADEILAGVNPEEEGPLPEAVPDEPPEQRTARMKKAATDAVALGVSREFVEAHMAPHLYPNEA